jgi:DNA-binding NtrC family response regulator
MSTVEPSGGTLPHHDGRRRQGGASPRPHLFLAMECERPTAPSARFILSDVEGVMIGRGPERNVDRSDENGARHLTIRVPDRWMSGTHTRLVKVLGKWVVEDAGSRNGTIVNGETTQKAILLDGDLLELGHTLFLYRDAVPTTPDDPAILDASRVRTPAPGLATLSAPLARELEQLEAVARSTVSVVLRGDSGTGKEVIARAVHALSGRTGPFVAMNCGALPETLIETELFGHKKGAFSGANEDRPGLVRSADKGTLFLDEIGDLPASSQAAFLRVLQEREVMPVGGTRPIAVDLRLIAATHQDLETQVARGQFRADLFARVAGYTMHLPRLADRREDLGLLIATLLERLLGGRAANVRFSPEAARAIFRCPWALNVRELEKCLGAAVVLAGAGPVELEHLPPAVRAPKPQVDLDATVDDHQVSDRPLSDEEVKHKEELDALLREHEGNVSQVARAMGKARMQIHRWVKRYKLTLESYRR